MAWTKEQIGNMALSHLGDWRINNFGDNTKESETVVLWYDACRLEMLESFRWNFAKARQSLSVHTETEPEGIWAVRYNLPADMAKARYVVNPAGRETPRIPYQIELATDKTLCLLTNIQDACLVYTMDMANAGLFPTTYVTALSHLLAARMAIAMTGKKSHQDAQYRLASAAISTARASNANEAAEPPPSDADWITARSGGTDFSPAAQVSVFNLSDGSN